MNRKVRKILIGTITFIFLFASAYVALAMGMGGGMGGFGGAGMSGARMGAHSGYRGLMGYSHNSYMRGSANRGSHGGGYGSMDFHYGGRHMGGGSS